MQTKFLISNFESQIARQGQLIAIYGDIEGGLDQIVVAHVERKVDQQVTPGLEVNVGNAVLDKLLWSY